MKKVFLVLLVMAGLVYGSSSKCETAWTKFSKYDKLYNLAQERDALFDMKVNNSLSLSYLDKVLVECEIGDKFDTLVSEVRADRIRISKILKKL